jgi:hypothetical protein
MRRNKTSFASLRGQLLFADMDEGMLTLDCILAKDGGTGSPVTFEARLPRRSRTPELAIELLFEWAAEAAEIDVTIIDGKAGPQVEIASSTRRVVLESDDQD